MPKKHIMTGARFFVSEANEWQNEFAPDLSFNLQPARFAKPEPIEPITAQVDFETSKDFRIWLRVQTMIQDALHKARRLIG